MQTKHTHIYTKWSWKLFISSLSDYYKTIFSFLSRGNEKLLKFQRFTRRYSGNYASSQLASSQCFTYPSPFSILFPSSIFFIPFSTILLFSLLNVFCSPSPPPPPPHFYCFPSTTTTATFPLFSLLLLIFIVFPPPPPPPPHFYCFPSSSSSFLLFW